MSANYAPTKNAFSASSSTPSSRATTSLTRSSSSSRIGRPDLEPHAVDAQRVHPPHREPHGRRAPLVVARLELRPRRRCAARGSRRSDDQPGERLVVALLRLRERDPRRVATSSGRRRPESSQRLGPPADRLVAAVVLVAHLADDLLDDVLQRHHAVDAAELVDHDGHLQPALAQRLQERVQLDGGRHDDRRHHDLGDRHLAAVGPVARAPRA